MNAVRKLIDLDQRDRAQQAAARLPEDLPVADLLRAADGVQRVARELAALRHHGGAEPAQGAGYDPHDVRSLYS